MHLYWRFWAINIASRRYRTRLHGLLQGKRLVSCKQIPADQLSLVTPHMASMTHESRVENISQLTDNIVTLLNGGDAPDWFMSTLS